MSELVPLPQPKSEVEQMSPDIMLVLAIKYNVDTGKRFNPATGVEEKIQARAAADGFPKFSEITGKSIDNVNGGITFVEKGDESLTVSSQEANILVRNHGFTIESQAKGGVPLPPQAQ